MDTLNFAYKDCDYFSFILVLNKKPPDFRENPGVEFKFRVPLQFESGEKTVLESQYSVSFSKHYPVSHF